MEKTIKQKAKSNKASQGIVSEKKLRKIYAERYLVPSVVTNRSQVYINNELTCRIKKFLAITAPNVSVSGFINTIVAAHFDDNAEVIKALYDVGLSKARW